MQRVHNCVCDDIITAHKFAMLVCLSLTLLNPLVSDCESEKSCVSVMPYEEARNSLEVLGSDPTKKLWLPGDSTTYGMYSVINEVNI